MNKWQNRFYYGGIAGIIILVYKSVMTYLGNNDPNTTFGFINLLFEVSLIVFSINIGSKKYMNQKLNGKMTYKQAFGHSFFIYFFAFFIGNLYQWIQSAFFKDNTETVQLLYEKFAGMYGEAFATNNLPIIEMMVNPLALFISYLLNALISTLLVSTILAFFIRKEKTY
ncbi:MAG: DUF4199 domain-containing protein [Bacteroidales bacterium]|jgi:hypothetical protein